MNWDDLRYFLALHRSGTLSGAARDLDVNHTTVSRRVESLEGDVGGALFVRREGGYHLTRLGEGMLPAALEAEASVHRVRRTALNADHSMRGEVRLTTSQLLATLLVIPAAVALREEHPDMVLDILVETRFMSLSRREADLALRLQLTPEAHASDSIRVSKLGTIGWSLFASPEFVRQWGLGSGAVPGELPVIEYDQEAPGRVGLEWIQEHDAQVVMRTNSMYSARTASSLGIGASVLPCPWGRLADLVEVAGPVHRSHVFLARHPDVKDNPRIRAVHSFLAEYARSTTDVFEWSGMEG